MASGEATMRIDGFDIEPKNPTPGDTVEVEATVRNIKETSEFNYGTAIIVSPELGLPVHKACFTIEGNGGTYEIDRTTGETATLGGEFEFRGPTELTLYTGGYSGEPNCRNADATGKADVTRTVRVTEDGVEDVVGLFGSLGEVESAAAMAVGGLAGFVSIDEL